MYSRLLEILPGFQCRIRLQVEGKQTINILLLLQDNKHNIYNKKSIKKSMKLLTCRSSLFVTNCTTRNHISSLTKSPALSISWRITSTYLHKICKRQGINRFAWFHNSYKHGKKEIHKACSCHLFLFGKALVFDSFRVPTTLTINKGAFSFIHNAKLLLHQRDKIRR